MKREVISCIKGVDVHTDRTLSKQPIFSPHLFSDDSRQATQWISWQASSVAFCMHSVLKAICNTPPQIDVYAYRKTIIRALLALLKPLSVFPLTLVQLFFANNQGKGGDKSQSEKKKSDKNKSKSDKQGNREQQEQRKPKTKG